MTNTLTALLLKVQNSTLNLKYQECKIMYASDVLCIFYIKVHDMTPLNFLQRLNTANIYHKYGHNAYCLYRY